jgi:hypothetical protein
MGKPGSTRILVVANRTAATPALIAEVGRRAAEGCTFDLLVPDVPDGQDAEATFELAVPLLTEAAGGPVRGLAKGPEPLESIEETLRAGNYDEVIVSTLPQGVSRWLGRDLPRQVSRLGVPVTVVTAAGRTGPAIVGALMR